MTDEQQLTAAGNEMSASFLAAKKRSDETLAKLEATPSTNTLKPAKLETGAEIKVPLFINIGDKIQIDTRTGEYIGRSK